MNEWQSMKTAPLDGRAIIGYGLDECSKKLVVHETWFNGWRWQAWALGGMWEPTHWMPFPAAPDGDKAGNRGQEIVSDG